MGDLNSIAYNCSNSSSTSCSSDMNSSSQGLDFYNLGVLNANMSHLMESTPPFLSPCESTEFSTGYLQDALFEFATKKRRRSTMFGDDDDNHDHEQSKQRIEPHQSYYDPYKIENSLENYHYMIQMENLYGYTGEPMNGSMSGVSEGLSYEALDSSPPSPKDSINSKPLAVQSNNSLQNIPRYGRVDEKKNKKVMKRVVYPFALVKPGGVEGDVTLNDINKRILMPPSRPVRHPVGDYACRPIVSPDGPGLSGKAVVAFTRIHTGQGRGTITIVRTKG